MRVSKHRHQGNNRANRLATRQLYCTPPYSAVLTTVSADTVLAVSTNVRAGQPRVGLSACGSIRNTFDESGRFFRQKERKSLGLDPQG